MRDGLALGGVNTSFHRLSNSNLSLVAVYAAGIADRVENQLFGFVGGFGFLRQNDFQRQLQVHVVGCRRRQEPGSVFLDSDRIQEIPTLF